MKKFNYVIKDEIGIHARPAGLLVKEAKKYESTITIRKGEKTAEAKKLMALISLDLCYISFCFCMDKISIKVFL